MKFLKILQLLLIVLVLISCSKEKDDPVKKTTVAEDKQNINLSVEEFYKNLEGISSGGLGNYILYSLFSSPGQQFNDAFLSSVLTQFELLNGNIFEGDRLRFAALKGIHEFQQNGWVKTGNSTGLVMKFPSREFLTSSDCELSLFDFSDQAGKFSSSPVFLPTKGNLILKRSGETVGSIIINSMQYDQTNPEFSIPNLADVSILTSPYTHIIKINKTAASSYRLNYSLTAPNRPSTSLELNIELVDADLGSLTSIENDVKTISGFASQGNLKVNFSINVLSLAAYTNPTTAQINQFLKADVQYSNIKVGDLTYEDSSGYPSVFITFSDGTKEDIEAYTGNFTNKFLSIFDAFIN